MHSKRVITIAIGLSSALLLTALPSMSLAINTTGKADSSKTAITTKPVQTNSVVSMNQVQQRSLDLLMQNYQHCFVARLENHAHPSLPKTFAVTIYEKHNTQCGGDPDTFHRRASYLIDRYGRVFKQSDIDNTLDLQFQFNETPTVISNLAQFQHPTKLILEKFGLKLYKLEKRAADTFVIFNVLDAPILTNEHNSKIANSRQQLFEQLLIANGGWDFMLRSEGGHEYYVEGSRRKIIDASSYQK